MFLPLLFAATLTIPDPAGDARGDGSYRIPARPALTEDALDLRAFTAARNGKGMRYTVGFGQIGNPWNAPSGFSAGVTDIFVKTDLGGQQTLADTGLRARGNGGWQYHLHITGFGSTLTGSDGKTTRPLPAPTVSISGTNLVIDAQIPAGSYAYWVTSSVYSPFSTDGLLRPTTAGGPLVLQAGRHNLPTPVDVLAPTPDERVFTEDTLAPVGQTQDRTTLVLGALGLAGLLLTTFATIAVWRRTGRR